MFLLKKNESEVLTFQLITLQKSLAPAYLKTRKSQRSNFQTDGKLSQAEGGNEENEKAKVCKYLDNSKPDIDYIKQKYL